MDIARQKDYIKEDLLHYVEILTRIKDLSSPQIDIGGSGDDYRAMLQRNFMQIGELSRVSTEILDKYFFPVIQSEEPLTEETIDRLDAFSDALINAYNLENQDLPLVYLYAVRMLRDALVKEDDELMVHALDAMIVACYALMDVLHRVTPCSDRHLQYRDEGLAAANRILAYLEPSRFEKLPDEHTREIVMINSRYIRVMFEGDDVIGDEAANQRVIDLMKQSLALAGDRFYRRMVPSYNWLYHEFRVLEYLVTLTDHFNYRKCSPAQIHDINAYTKRLVELVEGNDGAFDHIINRRDIELFRLRNAYLDGESTLAEYQNALLQLYGVYDKRQFELHSNLRALHTAYEYLLTLEGKDLTPEEVHQVKMLYDDLLVYMHQLPKTGSTSYMVTYFSDILKIYREIPGGMDFETFGLNLMAAIHPPTYVHTLSVATFAACLAKHLLRKDPQLFVGMPGYDTTEDVIQGAKDIENYIYHAALCHDFGKLTVIDTIMMYGRRLLDSDMALIHLHPTFGAYLLNRFEKTSAYAEVARGHHKWYDNSQGYPDDFDMEHSPYRTAISIVAFADCLDAATDDVGRSYKRGVSLDHFLSEVFAGSGTRYAPYLAELLADPEIRNDIETTLAVGRSENYREVWRILKRNNI